MTWTSNQIDGPIPIPVLDENGEPTGDFETGYHVNVTPGFLADHPEVEPYRVTPSALRQVWAGDCPFSPVETVALRFADEAEARAVLGWADAED
jgi:hypothetical protein